MPRVKWNLQALVSKETKDDYESMDLNECKCHRNESDALWPVVLLSIYLTISKVLKSHRTSLCWLKKMAQRDSLTYDFIRPPGLFPQSQMAAVRCGAPVGHSRDADQRSLVEKYSYGSKRGYPKHPKDIIQRTPKYKGHDQSEMQQNFLLLEPNFLKTTKTSKSFQ